MAHRRTQFMSNSFLIRPEFCRTAAILGEDGMRRLANAHVAVFGIGGVGGYVCEALARSGVGTLTLIDKDVVSLSNINRQIIALHSTLGRYKTEVMAERIHDIAPECRVYEHRMFYLPENADALDLSAFDFVVDAIDTVTAKIELILRAQKANVPLISCMGTGNKMDPSRLCIIDISQTHTCPLARVMRRELKARGVSHLTVCYSSEPPIQTGLCENGKPVPASTAFVPPSAGLLIASHVIQKIKEDAKA